MPSISRRHFLAVGATGFGFGAAGGYISGSDPPPDEQPTCDPRERFFDTTDWPAPRYDPAGTARAPARNAPSGDLREQWHAEFPASDMGQPVITAGRIAVAMAGNWQRIVTMELASGQEVWSEPVSEGRVDAGDLVAAGSDLFYLTQTEEAGHVVLAVSLRDGDRRWSAPADRSPGSRPVVTADGHVWITDYNQRDEGSSVVALSADTGIECFSWRVNGNGEDVVLVDEDHVYHGTRSGAVALDRENGDVQWQTDEERYPRVVTDDWLYATASSGWLSAHDIESGAVEWTVESESYPDGESDPENPEVITTDEAESTARPSYRDLAVADGILLTREDVHSGHADRITAFDAESGDELWQLAPEDEWPDPDDRFWYTGPVIAGDRAFVCENRREGNSYLQAIDINSGDIIDSVEMSNYALAAPVVGRGVVVVSQHRGVGCYGSDQ